MNSLFKILIVITICIVSALAFSYFYLPVNRIGISSELIMLGDINNDNKWDKKDKKELTKLLNNPFYSSPLNQSKIDLNKNGLIDEEDLILLSYIYNYKNPYTAEQKARENKISFPRPRELFKYLPTYEYIQRPLIVLPHPVIKESDFTFLQELKINQNIHSYNDQLLYEIYNEGLRVSLAFAKRRTQLTPIEINYAENKIQLCNLLFQQNKHFELLLNLISLTEDAETLTISTQSDFIQKILYFRDNLKTLLTSKEFTAFTQGKISYLKIFEEMENHLKSDLNISLNLNTLPPPRDFSDLKNYLDRAQWQIFKSKTKKNDFKKLVLFAQYDRRYLRAVSKTSPKFQDLQLQNHNLPMILLFREALKITNSDKKAAVGLLDEAIRIPMAWVKSIPKELLPSSVALENFLLPGNKEDGSDKSRHWNVFGGVALYKSPKESLILALKREMMDLREQNYTQKAMQEFIRDTIANINGIYYVVSINPDLIQNLQ